MKIKNLSGRKYLLAGVELQINEILPLSSFGNDTQISPYLNEFIAAEAAGVIVFLSDDSTIGNEKELTGVTAEDLVIIPDTQDTTNEQLQACNNEDTFYYNFKDLEMKFGDIIEVEFKGFLKNSFITVMDGEIEAQFIIPIMNKINITTLNSYSIDSDFRLKDPVIRLTAAKKSSVKLYLDGAYCDTTKTKDQYLREIYSEVNFPQSSQINVNELAFKCNFLKTVKNNKFIDVVNSSQGTITNGSTLLNFNSFEDGAYVNFGNILKTSYSPFTFNIWFNMGGDIYNRQYIFYKNRYYFSYVQNGSLYLYINRSTRFITNITNEKWYMLTFTYDGIGFNVYVNETLQNPGTFSTTFSTSNDNLYFGGKGRSETLRDGKIGEVAFYTYSMSKGMISYLYNTNHPNVQFQTNLINGVYVNSYSCAEKNNILPGTSYDLDLFEKELNNVNNLLNSEVLQDVDSTLLTYTNIGQVLTVATGKIYIPEDGKYIVSVQNTNYFDLSFDAKTVLCNFGETANTGTAWCEEGYYNFKFRTVSQNGISFKVSQHKSSETEFVPFIYKIEDTDDVVLANNVYINLENNVFSSSVSNIVDNSAKLTTPREVLEYTDVNSTKIPIDSNFRKTQFSISFWLNPLEERCYLFSQGNEKWTPFIQARVQDEKLYFKYMDCEAVSHKEIDDNEWVKIDIVSNGDKIDLYINGSKDKDFKLDITQNSWYFSDSEFYIGKMPKGTMEWYYQGDFQLSKFKYILSTRSKTEIENKYAEEFNEFNEVVRFDNRVGI